MRHKYPHFFRKDSGWMSESRSVHTLVLSRQSGHNMLILYVRKRISRKQPTFLVKGNTKRADYTPIRVHSIAR